MAATADWTKNIDEIYDQSLNAQKAKLKGRYDKGVAAYQKQLDDAPEQYQKLKNHAYVSHAQTERSRQEALANMGLSAAGGTSQTLQQRNTNTLLNTLGDVSRQQQDFTDNVNLALANLSTDYETDLSSLTAQMESDKNVAKLAQDQWQEGYELQQKQFEQSQQDSIFSQAFSLYNKRLITKAQFKAMTGIDVR
ncbi:MAG: hypothetical protein ACOX8Q_10210 [Christensenellales bacterium]|jgi:hypothetical protein